MTNSLLQLPSIFCVFMSLQMTKERPHSLVSLCLQFCSCAHYVTDGTGNVDVRTAESVGGSYKGVFPAGLLTTLRPAPHELQSHRLYRRNTSLPWKVSASYPLYFPWIGYSQLFFFSLKNLFSRPSLSSYCDTPIILPRSK